MKKQTYKKMFNVALTTTLAAGAVVAVAPQAEAAISFTDVKESNVHYADIMNLAERGIIRGYGDGTFRPGISINRGHAAHIIAEIIDLDTTNVTNPNFTDITTKHANYGAIAALAKAGIIHGFEDGSYRPNDKLTRGQMAKIIAKAFNLNPSSDQLPFKDVERSIYKDHIIALFENNVTKGMTATFFGEKTFVTRGQLSSFVVRAEKTVETPPVVTPPVEEPPVVTPPVVTPPVENPPSGGGGGGGTTQPTKDEVDFMNNLEAKLEALPATVGITDNIVIDVNNTNLNNPVVTITSNTNVTKEELIGLRDKVVENFLGMGTTGVLSSVTINGTQYSTKEQLENETAIAIDLATALAFSGNDADGILKLAPEASIWPVLEKDLYSGTITLNFKESNLRVPVTITLTEKVQ